MCAELPWERAGPADARYAAWAAWCCAEAAAAPTGVWRKLQPAELRLLRRALQPSASRRATLDELLSDAWLAEPAAPLPTGQCFPSQVRRCRPEQRAPGSARRVSVSGTR